MRYRDASVGWYGGGAGHARSYLEWDTGFGQRLTFLRAPPKNERVTAFQSHDRLSAACLRNEQSIDFDLLTLLLSGRFADVNPLRSG
jgi:hypothetical protein